MSDTIVIKMDKSALAALAAEPGLVEKFIQQAKDVADIAGGSEMFNSGANIKTADGTKLDITVAGYDSKEAGAQMGISNDKRTLDLS